MKTWLAAFSLLLLIPAARFLAAERKKHQTSFGHRKRGSGHYRGAGSGGD